MKSLKANNNLDLSVIILNYNSGSYLKKCLNSLNNSDLKKYKIETIVVDNNSTDKSVKLAKKISGQKIGLKFLCIKTNKGFASGNNEGVKSSNPNSRYVLFLNPDTIVDPNTLSSMISFFDDKKEVDAGTCWITLAATNKIQPECHRGFPTPWRSFCHFTGISRLFKGSKLFDGYFLGNLNLKRIHKIEACVGAFLMVKRNVGNAINWWNEKYFFYGEDLDFCYKLFENKYNLYFNPNVKITHYQGISSGIISKTTKISQANRTTKIRSALASTEAMKIFYKENLINKYPIPLQWMVMSGIKLLEVQRLIKAKYL